MDKLAIKKTAFVKNSSAFTLAEVLITLGIIGVVAALTIPALIQSQQNKATVSAVKKAYTTLSQAYTSAVQDNGPPETWDLSTYTSLLDILSPYLSLMKNCGTSSNCSATSYHSLNGVDVLPAGYMGSAMFKDGSAILTQMGTPKCTTSRGSTNALKNICCEIMFDVNGPQKPNVLGKDYFTFYVTKYGLIPSGTVNEWQFPFGAGDYGCDLSSYRTGYGCTAWVIYNENMDYLKCNNLSWSGPLKCQ